TIQRRQFLRSMVAASAAGMATPLCAAAPEDVDRAQANRDAKTLTLESRIRGMLIGALIGDALGGPIEFLSADRVKSVMPGARTWSDDQVLDSERLAALAASLTMLDYRQLRPQVAAYGPWVSAAPAGTLTDDSRHKIVLMRAIRNWLNENGGHGKVGRPKIPEFRTNDIARQILIFRPLENSDPEPKTAALLEEGMREYRYAAEAQLGKSGGLPVQRLWNGRDNCSGQMMFPPLAAIFPGLPTRAYEATFRFDFIDTHAARDFAAALNAGLSEALSDERSTAQDTTSRWQTVLRAMRDIDPYRMADVPFAGRWVNKILDQSESIAKRSQGRPSAAYQLLETEGKPTFYWDAHYTMLVPLTMLHLCRFNPLAAMHLTLDFGHDTDSYAQVLGAMIGAVHGEEVFPRSMRRNVSKQLQSEYGESIDNWVNTLNHARRLF
ncbi:MAG: ADP-ribosylglycohydrolase family protein, partial [Planctomycetota bacterium]